MCARTRHRRIAMASAGSTKKLQKQATAILSGSFPGVPVNQTVQDTLATPDDASCWERSRDSVLRFFVRNQNFFQAVAIFLAVCFVLNICVVLVAFWGAVLGVGVLGRKDICKLDYLRSFSGCITTHNDQYRCTSSGFNVSFEGTHQYPPQICISGFTSPDGCTGPVEYVADVCNLSQK